MITGHIRGYIEHYFAPHPTQQVRALFLSTAILNFADASISLFVPLYLHTVVGLSVPQVLLFFAAVYALYVFLLPIGGRISRRHGYEHTILFSSPFLIMWYVSLFAMQWDVRFGLVAIAALVMQKVLYWPGYHANFSSFGTAAEQGREVSNMSAIAGLAAVVAPAIGGAIIAGVGYATLFIGASILILVSNIPLIRLPERFEAKPFEYWRALKHPFKKLQRRRTLAYFGFGEELLAMIAWPIFMMTVIPNLTSLGLIVSLAMLLNVAAVLYVGRLSDEGDRGAVQRSGTMYEVASWLVRPLIGGGLGVFMIDTFYRVSKNMMAVPLVSSVYDEARESTDPMATIIHFEMALSIGKATAATLAGLILWRFPNAWTAVFMLAAGFAAMYGLFSLPLKRTAGGIPLTPIITPTNEPL